MGLSICVFFMNKAFILNTYFSHQLSVILWFILPFTYKYKNIHNSSFEILQTAILCTCIYIVFLWDIPKKQQFSHILTFNLTFPPQMCISDCLAPHPLLTQTPLHTKKYTPTPSVTYTHTHTHKHKDTLLQAIVFTLYTNVFWDLSKW